MDNIAFGETLHEVIFVLNKQLTSNKQQ